MSERWFEDYVPGTTAEHGPLRVEEDDVVDFGRRFDPQPFHVDAEAAAAGPFGGLIASGWHTCALMMRLLADKYLSPVSSLGSPGVDELRWLKPVYPGDRLTVRGKILATTPSRSKPDRGVIRGQTIVTNQDGAEVMTFVSIVMYQRRPQPQQAGIA